MSSKCDEVMKKLKIQSALTLKVVNIFLPGSKILFSVTKV